MSSTDKDWEKWGADNPFHGVLSDDKFLDKDIDKQAVKEFYNSGKADIDGVIKIISQINGGKPPKFKKAVDFGCGVGRLTVPLAAHAAKTVGIDVSPSMIKVAARHTPKPLKSKIKYVVSGGGSSLSLPRGYDLVHSFIVLQHIPPKRGEKFIKKMLGGLDDGGYAALHITIGRRATGSQKTVTWLRDKLPPVHYAANAAKGRPVLTPRMRMHYYDLKRIVEIFNQHGFNSIDLSFTDHGGYLGVMIIGQKTKRLKP
jgi:2-polyprenyl-3-methyl-5-hydroxy-6-metoxy-1,4-benzoquinol methylase